MHLLPADDGPNENHTRVTTGVQPVGRGLHAVAGPERCRDLNVWAEAVAAAPDLALRQADGRTRVSDQVVKEVLLRLRQHMDWHSKPDPGANAKPGIDELATQTGHSRASCQQALRAGVIHGYLIQTERGRKGRRATFAAALPPVDNTHRVEAPQPYGPLRVEEPQGCSPHRVEVPQPHPLPSTSPSQPRAPAREATQLPLVATVGGEGASQDPVQILVDLMPRHVARHIDPANRRLVRAVAGARADGWGSRELARAVLALDVELGPLDALDDPARTAGAIASRIGRVGKPHRPRTAAPPCTHCAGRGVLFDETVAGHHMQVEPCPHCTGGHR